VAAANRCRDVCVLDLAGASPVTDYFVIATGTSSRQMQTVVAKMDDFLSAHRDVVSLGREGLQSQRWVLLDLVEVVVHVFAPEARTFYALELLWGDVPRVDWQEGWTPPAATDE
jgi:ribosome-associated protein